MGLTRYEYSTDVSLQWFLLQTLIMVATMVMCIRCVSICIAYRDQQLYNELFAAQAVVQGWPNGERRRRRRRWVGDDPPLSESSVQSLPMINYKSCVKTCSDSSARKCDTLETSSETKSAQSGSVWVYDSCTSCSVCLDEFVEGEVLCQLKPCGHLFHEGCIFPWLVQRSGNCPLCKTAVQPPITRQNSDFGAETPNRQWLDEEETEQDFVSNVLSAMGIIRIPSNEDENNLREPLMDDEQHSLEVDELV
eukprot:CAMPEP_0116005330 /NCGR_PEP_ID=MMETSP0321-20121206/1108_1 /TAXON_ID=163516 /ORGANISM="Leptocylindrus danicus var. danicus, Strain B650" /LENGTH=249 /DNA_ID=CAMNT_0003473751 /DNA_START=139 /DNA_END=888 /DNA_ORIENTATION=-